MLAYSWENRRGLPCSGRRMQIWHMRTHSNSRFNGSNWPLFFRVAWSHLRLFGNTKIHSKLRLLHGSWNDRSIHLGMSVRIFGRDRVRSQRLVFNGWWIIRSQSFLQGNLWGGFCGRWGMNSGDFENRWEGLDRRELLASIFNRPTQQQQYDSHIKDENSFIIKSQDSCIIATLH